MGGPNPESLADPVMPELALTLAEIAARRWKLKARCPTCRVVLRVTVDALIRVNGPDAIWWGRSPPCPVEHDGWRCEGRLIYLAQGGPRTLWRELNALDPHQLASVKAMRERGASRYGKKQG